PLGIALLFTLLTVGLGLRYRKNTDRINVTQ
ncbi:MAG: hypothetical protein JWQ21_2640, partial [Herminiimonas sp.]|nr:hypothetical protein [Herminiimonas sp.]